MKKIKKGPCSCPTHYWKVDPELPIIVCSNCDAVWTDK